jgi:hypothetical protein
VADFLVQPVVQLFCRPGKLSSAHALARDGFTFLVQNELLTDWTLKVEIGIPGSQSDTPLSQTYERHATADRTLFDDAHASYLNEPVPADQAAGLVNAFNDVPAAIRGNITIKLNFKKFSKILVEYMTREKNDTFTLADPDPADKDRILASFKVIPGTKKRDFEYPEESITIKDIPCALTKAEYVINTSGRPPFCLLRFLLLIPQDKRLEVMRALIAADHSQLVTLGAKGASKTLRKRLLGWTDNFANFIFNFTDIGRSQSVFNDMVDRSIAAFNGGANTRLGLVEKVRDIIDAKMVAANHWAEDREVDPGEEYQRALSDVLGSILDSKQLASPVMLLREVDQQIIERSNLQVGSLEERRSWVLFITQAGVGHCGEHSNLSWFVLRQMMLRVPAINTLLSVIIRSGNANSLHDYVIGGMLPQSFVFATVTSTDKRTRRLDKGKSLAVFDLAKMLNENSGKQGFVCDPYLAKTKQPLDLTLLLKKLNNPNRGVLQCQFVVLDEALDDNHSQMIHPAPKTLIPSENLGKPQAVKGI